MFGHSHIWTLAHPDVRVDGELRAPPIAMNRAAGPSTIRGDVSLRRSKERKLVLSIECKKRVLSIESKKHDLLIDRKAGVMVLHGRAASLSRWKST